MTLILPSTMGVASARVGRFSAAPNTAAWNPSDKSASCALSNGNLTATGSTGDPQWARGNQSRPSSPRALRITFTDATGATIGIATSGSVGTYTGETDAVAVLYANGFVGLDDDFSVDTGITWTDGGVVDMLHDPNAQILRFRANEGSWSTPVDISGLNGVERFPIVGVGNGGVASADFTFAYQHFLAWGYQALSSMAA